MAGSSMVHRQLHQKCIAAVCAFRPDFAVMAFDNALCNRQAQTVAMVHAPRPVYPVEAFENVFEIVRRDFCPGFVTVSRQCAQLCRVRDSVTRA